MAARNQARKAAPGELRRERADAERRRILGALGIVHDPRTAAGQREVEPRDVRGVGKRASLVDPGALIKRHSDRTQARTKAIAAFDDLCHSAYSGLYPEPRFERGVDVSRMPGMPPARCDAMGEMQRLAARIGDEAQAILHLRIFERRSFAWMAEQGIGDAERLGVLFLAAVDAVARFYGYAGPSQAQIVMERQLGALG